MSIDMIERPLRESDPAGTRVHWTWVDGDGVTNTSHGTITHIYHNGIQLIATCYTDDDPTHETPLRADALMTYALIPPTGVSGMSAEEDAQCQHGVDISRPDCSCIGSEDWQVMRSNDCYECDVCRETICGKCGRVVAASHGSCL